MMDYIITRPLGHLTTREYLHHRRLVYSHPACYHANKDQLLRCMFYSHEAPPTTNEVGTKGAESAVESPDREMIDRRLATIQQICATETQILTKNPTAKI